MIVRISTEGQYEISDDEVSKLNELDNAAVAACESQDEASFRQTFNQLLAFVREHGTAVADDILEGSDVILPPPDISLQEASEEFSGDGLIPG